MTIILINSEVNAITDTYTFAQSLVVFALGLGDDVLAEVGGHVGEGEQRYDEPAQPHHVTRRQWRRLQQRAAQYVQQRHVELKDEEQEERVAHRVTVMTRLSIKMFIVINH